MSLINEPVSQGRSPSEIRGYLSTCKSGGA